MVDLEADTVYMRFRCFQNETNDIENEQINDDFVPNRIDSHTSIALTFMMNQHFLRWQRKTIK